MTSTRRFGFCAHLFRSALLLHYAFGLPSEPVSPSLELSLTDISIAELGSLLDAGALTSRELTSLYLSRIAEVNDELHAIIEVDSAGALSVATRLDKERSHGHIRGPLHGIPVLVKDNYAVVSPTKEGYGDYDDGNDSYDNGEGGQKKDEKRDGTMLTGAGSTCLAERAGRPATEAAVVVRLRDAGAIILGKTNLDEFSGARGLGVPNGWSPRGGQTTGVYVEHQTVCGSSGGSAVAAALGLAAATLGTETAGSITCPAWTNNVVGIKPTVGLASRHGIVPVTPRQDTAGPLARGVADAALLLDAIAGRDARDNWTLAQPWWGWEWERALLPRPPPPPLQLPRPPPAPPRYATPAVLNASALAGRRLGVFWTDEDAFGARYFANWALVRAVFEAALADLEAAGARLVRLSDRDLLLPAAAPSARELVRRIDGNMTIYAIPDGRESMQRYLDELQPPPPPPPPSKNDGDDGDDDGIRTLADLLRCVEADDRERASDLDYTYLKLMAAAGGAGSGSGSGSPEIWAAYEAATALTRGPVVDAMARHDLDALVLFPDMAVILASAPGLPVVTVPMGALGQGAATRRRRVRVRRDGGSSSSSSSNTTTGAGAGAGAAAAAAAAMLVETAPGFPLGVSFVADRWAEEALIGYAYAYEQVSRHRNSLRPYVQPKSDLDSVLPRA